MGHIVKPIKFPEIVVGFVAPIGTPIKPSIVEFKKHFEAIGYKVLEVKVTDSYELLKQFIPPKTKLEEKPAYKRYKSYIEYGNQIRHHTNDDEILAAMSIQSIVEKRLALKKNPNNRYEKTVYLVHQFKRSEEIALLRSVYGKIFFQVSIYSRREARVDFLSRDFAQGMKEPNHNHYRRHAEELVDIDENQRNVPSGQRVGKIFHDADFILNKDVNFPKIPNQIERFFELIFSSNKITPTRMEYGMFLARSAALRTSDLSRQVGAAIFSSTGEIVSIGSNEVPKARGGTYWPNEQFDDREYQRGEDSNDQRKLEILDELLSVVKVDRTKLSMKTSEKLDKTAFMDALEYGRIIHAEMSAISDAARTGRSIYDSILYSTTFPCHMCAKHIVAAGIKKVVFLEPYPKSLASRLHSDSITIEASERGDYTEYPSVEFEHFFGVTPRRYGELFYRSKRKDADGKFQDYINGDKVPNLDIKSPFYTQLEDTVLESLKSASRAP